MSDSGDALATWLGGMAGRTLSGTTYTVTTRDGPMTASGMSCRYQIGRTIDSGGQAAVAEVTFPVHWLEEKKSKAENDRSIKEVREWVEWTTPPASSPTAEKRQLVARVEFYPRDARELRRREVLLFLAHLSRTQHDRYPALIRVKESFLVEVPIAQLPRGQVAVPGSQHFSVWVDVMERCTPLRDELKAHPNGFDHLEGIQMVSPLLLTVGRLYEDHSLIHRDIDEGNALIAPEGTLRLGDWGIAHPMSSDHTHTNTVPFGKWPTTPPENREGDWAIGHFTDAWQCGRLLGYVLTGSSPFLDELASKVALNSPRLRALPAELRGVIEALCNPDPKKRSTTKTAATALGTYRRVKLNQASTEGAWAFYQKGRALKKEKSREEAARDREWSERKKKEEAERRRKSIASHSHPVPARFALIGGLWISLFLTTAICHIPLTLSSALSPVSSTLEWAFATASLLTLLAVVVYVLPIGEENPSEVSAIGTLIILLAVVGSAVLRGFKPSFLDSLPVQVPVPTAVAEVVSSAAQVVMGWPVPDWLLGVFLSLFAIGSGLLLFLGPLLIGNAIYEEYGRPFRQR